MANQKITIPITECDVEMFQDLARGCNNQFSWTFKTDKGINVDVHFTDEFCDKCMATDDLKLCPVENTLYCKECLEEGEE